MTDITHKIEHLVTIEIVDQGGLLNTATVLVDTTGQHALHELVRKMESERGSHWLRITSRKVET